MDILPENAVWCCEKCTNPIHDETQLCVTATWNGSILSVWISKDYQRRWMCGFVAPAMTYANVVFNSYVTLLLLIIITLQLFVDKK